MKILFQIQAMTAAKGKYKGILPTLSKVVHEDGVRALYKGNGANVIRVIPVYALKFALNDEFKRVLQSHPGEVIGGAKLLMAGTMAGACQQLCTYPLEVVRTRLALCATMGVQYKGIVDCAVQTARIEGIRGLYKGLGPTLLSGAPYVGLQMSAFEVLKRAATGTEVCMPAASGLPTIRSDVPVWPRGVAYSQPGEAPGIVTKLLLGALSGLFAQTITYPGDTIRRRMQTNGAGGAARLYTTSWDCCVKTVRAEGVRGLYHGLFVNMVRCLPGAAIQFAAYDTLKTLLV